MKAKDREDIRDDISEMIARRIRDLKKNHQVYLDILIDNNKELQTLRTIPDKIDAILDFLGAKIEYETCAVERIKVVGIGEER